MEGSALAFVATVAVPVVALLALWLQLTQWHRQHGRERERDAREAEARFGKMKVKLEGLSKDIEGNTEIVLRMERNLQAHEKKCDERWRRNHEKHDETGQRVAKLEARRET